MRPHSPQSSPEMDVSFPVITDWETAYSNRIAVTDAPQWRQQAAAAAAAFVSSYDGKKEIDIPFGSHPRERLDIFHPLGHAQGTLIFIHGGYWRSATKETHWHLAAGPLLNGWRVAFVEYPLCPEVTIPRIAEAVRRGVELIARRLPDDPLVLAGHSAGGHLATWLGCEAGGLARDVARRIARLASLSGLHDLRPLVHALELNADLGLDADQAAHLSPALSAPVENFELICLAGSSELPEFKRQNLLLANIWSGFGIPTRAVEIAQANHYTLLDGLCDPHSTLTKRVLPPLTPTP